MLLILAEPYDSLVAEVAEELTSMKYAYEVIFSTDLIEIQYLKITPKSTSFLLIKNSKDKIYSSKITKFWYRRGELNLKVYSCDSHSEVEKKFITNDKIALKNFIYKYLESLPSLGSYFWEDNSINNKIFNLHIAKKVGLKIPDITFISANSYLLNRKTSVGGAWVTKGISESMCFHQDYILSAGTSLVPGSVEYINPGYSLLQKHCVKKYDIRVLYLNDKIFASLLHSQDDAGSKIDSRLYIEKYRISSIKLSNIIEKKICKLIKILKYNFCLVDFVLTATNELIFLEINPNGQVGAYSRGAEWNIGYEIAKHLTQMK